MADTGTSILGAAHTTSSADDFVAELWSDGIYRYFERGTIFRNLIEDYSSMIKVKVLVIPYIYLKLT